MNRADSSTKSRRPFRTLHALCAVCTAILFAVFTATAQKLVQAPRVDGAQTLLRVYAPAASGCAPLALISPGAGGSEDGYKYLAKALQLDGWRAIVMGHQESGAPALQSAMREAHGVKKGLTELVNDPKAYDGRLMDIAAALKWAGTS